MGAYPCRGLPVGGDRIRTDDLMRAKHIFYHLNYTPKPMTNQVIKGLLPNLELAAVPLAAASGTAAPPTPLHSKSIASPSCLRDAQGVRWSPAFDAQAHQNKAVLLLLLRALL
jgi:hypothetical protein